MQFLIIHSNYLVVEVGFIKNQKLINYSEISFKHASAQLIPIIDTLLTKQALTLNQLDYIAINAGPGPFTTLRTMIATANGLAYSTHVPLVALNNLEVLVRRSETANGAYVFGLLHAFGNDVYYAIFDQKNGALDLGVCSIKVWIERFKKFLQQYPHESLSLVGNGFIQQKSLLQQELGNIIPDNIIAHASIEQMACQAEQQWQEQYGITQQVIPLYLKPYFSEKRDNIL